MFSCFTSICFCLAKEKTGEEGFSYFSQVRSITKLNVLEKIHFEYYNQNFCLPLRLDSKKVIALFRILFHLRQQNEPSDVFSYIS